MWDCIFVILCRNKFSALHIYCLGAVDKVDTLKRYRFSLAFENSNEEDYVTEKFFQSLVAGDFLYSLTIHPHDLPLPLPL